MTVMWREGWRSLRRSPGFAAVAMATLALGLGANTALFGVLNALLLRPLPFPDVHRLVDVSEHHPLDLCAGCSVGTSHGTWRAWQGAARSFAGLEAYQEFPVALGLEEGARRVSGAAVSGGWFGVMGVATALGRPILPPDDTPGAPRVTVLSHRLWQASFGGDPHIIGRALRINGESYQVVGVMPREFGYPEFATLWVPMVDRFAGQAPDDRSLGVVGRLAPGIAREAAEAEMSGIAEDLASDYPSTHAGWTVRIAPVERPLADSGANTGIGLGLAAAGFVLLITCANLANLLLARGADRRRELAIRAALGASRRALVRAGLGEGLLVALIGGILGIIVGLWAVRGLLAVIGTTIPVWLDLGFDWRVYLFVLVLTTSTGILLGLAPALEAGRVDVHSALRSGGVTSSDSRRESLVRNALVVAQVSLALAVLVGSGLAVRSFLVVSRTDNLGIDPSRILRGDLGLLGAGYSDATRAREFGMALVERLASYPGVEAAAAAHTSFLGSFVGTASQVHLDGADEPLPMSLAPRFAQAITPGYFAAVGLELRGGRGITPEDVHGQPLVVVVNEATAERLWPGLDPLGRGLTVGSGETARRYTVVGVVESLVGNLGRGPVALIYTSFAQHGGRPLTVEVRTAGDPMTMAASLLAAVRELDPDEPVDQLMTGREFLAVSTAPMRFMLALMGSLGALALVLAVLGLYSLMEYSVARRTRELGIRMALGADAPALVRMVLGRAARLVAIGCVLGFPVALAAARLMRAAVFGVPAWDPFVLITVPFLLAVVTITAAWFPARRATRVDPVSALRSNA